MKIHPVGAELSCADRQTLHCYQQLFTSLIMHLTMVVPRKYDKGERIVIPVTQWTEWLHSSCHYWVSC